MKNNKSKFFLDQMTPDCHKEQIKGESKVGHFGKEWNSK